MLWQIDDQVSAPSAAKGEMEQGTNQKLARPSQDPWSIYWGHGKPQATSREEWWTSTGTQRPHSGLCQRDGIVSEPTHCPRQVASCLGYCFVLASPALQWFSCWFHTSLCWYLYPVYWGTTSRRTTLAWFLNWPTLGAPRPPWFTRQSWLQSWRLKFHLRNYPNGKFPKQRCQKCSQPTKPRVFFPKLCCFARKNLQKCKPLWHCMRPWKQTKWAIAKWPSPRIHQACLPWRPSREPRVWSWSPWAIWSSPKVMFPRVPSQCSMVVSFGKSSLGSNSMIGRSSHSHRNAWFHSGGARQLKKITTWNWQPSHCRPWVCLSRFHAWPTWTRLKPTSSWLSKSQRQMRNQQKRKAANQVSLPRKREKPDRNLKGFLSRARKQHRLQVKKKPAAPVESLASMAMQIMRSNHQWSIDQQKALQLFIALWQFWQINVHAIWWHCNNHCISITIWCHTLVMLSCSSANWLSMSSTREQRRPGWPHPLSRDQTRCNPVLQANFYEEYQGRGYLVLQWSNGWKQW